MSIVRHPKGHPVMVPIMTAPLPHLNAEARRFYAPKPDFIDIGGEVMAAGFRISACGKTLMSGPNDIALADLRAAHAAIGRQIQIMESGNG